MKKLFIIQTSFLIALLLTLILIPEFAAAKTNGEEGDTNFTEIPTGYMGIYTPSDLDEMRSNLSGKYILMNDINLSDATAVGGEFYRESEGWQPIGTESLPFSGVLDGNGYKIIGLKINILTENKMYAGLIGYAKNAEVKNLGMVNGEIKVQNTSIDSSMAKVIAGGIIGYGYNIGITNSYNENPVYAFSNISSYAGGIVGYIDSTSKAPSKIISSHNHAEIKGKSAAGGVAGTVSWTNITHSFNDGEINKGYQHGQMSGGIAGKVYNSSIDESYNTGDITYGADHSAGGGIVGYASASSLNNISNRGSVSSNHEYSDGGGIAGKIYGNTKILRANNSGNVKSSSYVGGITGQASNSMTVQSYNSGDISGNYSGGIYGYSSTAHVKDSFNLGKISGSYNSGGIVGKGTDSTIQTVYNLGRITAGYNVMGSKGQIAGPFTGTVTNSYYWSENNYGDTIGTRIPELGKMKQQASFENFDFSTVWKIGGIMSYSFPTLQSQEFYAGNEHNVNIEMKSNPFKTVYARGEQVDLTGAVITATTNWGNENELSMTQNMIYSDVTKYTGTQSVSVNYEGLHTSFKIIVKNSYTVTFKDIDGTILKTERVLEGDSANPPDFPDRDGYTFTGWNKDVSNITSNLTVTAQFKPKTYTVIFQTYDGIMIETKSVDYGESVVPPEAPNRVGYNFVGWNHSLHFITSDIIVKPQYNNSFYQVIFKGYNDEKLSDFYVEHGSSASAPNPPIRKGYTFIGWDKNFSAITSDLTITARYKINTYTVTFKEDSTTLKTVKTNYNSKVTMINPTKSGETFIGWYHDAGFTKKFNSNETITGNKTLYAKFVKNTANPISIRAYSVGYNKIKVSWAKVSGAAGYEIYRATSKSGVYSKITTIKRVSTVSYTNSGLSTGKSYYYKIRAYRLVDGIKVYSSYTRLDSAKPVLAVPTKMANVKASSTSIRVTWSKVSEASGYEVYRATSISGSYKKVKIITRNTTTSYTNKSLSKRKTYYYKVRSYRIVNGTKRYSSYSTVRGLKM